MTDKFRIGVISSVHGIRGEAKVFVTSDEPERFRRLKQVHAQSPESALHLKGATRTGEKTDRDGVLLELSSVHFFKRMAICKFKGIDTPEEIRKSIGMELWVPRAEGIRLRKGEFYVADLIGLPVITDAGETLGTVKAIWPTGANEVVTVQRKNGEELLLPYIKDCILEVNPEEGFLKVHLMEGLL